ncbi:winged helix-turn-helix domain-containing protein [Patescibacteria group bacterium]|nr:winged helix-turn-helix domain-containing protein [Patescibacteria group bacterium]
MDDIGLFLQYQKEVAESKLKTIDRFQKGLQEQPVKRTSMVDVVEQVLIKAGRPLHISEIIEIADRDFGAHLDRDSVVSFVIKRMNAGRTFIRTAPNTFALRE